VSDAGTPLVSDPGFALVRDVARRGDRGRGAPGPSAVTTALVASGLPAERWLFVGFLPRKRAELQRLLAEVGETLVAFESPRRLAATLRLLADADPERPAAVLPRADQACTRSPPRQRRRARRSFRGDGGARRDRARVRRRPAGTASRETARGGAARTRRRRGAARARPAARGGAADGHRGQRAVSRADVPGRGGNRARGTGRRTVA